eukprot:1323589-Rhodomonas_salina.6
MMTRQTLEIGVNAGVSSHRDIPALAFWIAQYCLYDLLYWDTGGLLESAGPRWIVRLRVCKQLRRDLIVQSSSILPTQKADTNAERVLCFRDLQALAPESDGEVEVDTGWVVLRFEGLPSTAPCSLEGP